MPTLTLQFKNKSLGEYELQKGVSLSIGRRDTNDVVIEDPSVSGHHAKVDSLGDRFVLIDLQSKNGSFVNEQLINSHWLQDEDVISIGGHTLVFQHRDEVQALAGDSNNFDETQALNTTQRRRMMAQSNPTKSINVTRYWDKGQKRGKLRDIEPEDSEYRTEDEKKEPAGFLSYLAGGKGRIDGLHEITVDEYVSGKRFEDAVCNSFYPIDLHDKAGVRPKQMKTEVVPSIPLRALIPKESRNFLVAGRCASSDQLANSALRVQASCMAMGQAAGAAAALASLGNTTPLHVPLEGIRKVLREHGAIIPGV